ncbi:MAG: hypothetical protein AAGF15_12190 [Pseudomonadota bacterium]
MKLILIAVFLVLIGHGLTGCAVFSAGEPQNRLPGAVPRNIYGEPIFDEIVPQDERRPNSQPGVANEVTNQDGARE